jgi:DNA-directed RNA polymerase specialized sigma24 family protein
MTAKEYLTQALSIDRLLAAKRRLLKKLQWQSVSLSASVSSDKVMGTHHGSMTTADKIMDLEMEIVRQENALVDKQREIIAKIQVVCNPTWIAVLTDRYITGMTFEDISESMSKSVRTISVWHGQALQAFRKETGLK